MPIFWKNIDLTDTLLAVGLAAKRDTELQGYPSVVGMSPTIAAVNTYIASQDATLRFPSKDELRNLMEEWLGAPMAKWHQGHFLAQTQSPQLEELHQHRAGLKENSKQLKGLSLTNSIREKQNEAQKKLEQLSAALIGDYLKNMASFQSQEIQDIMSQLVLDMRHSEKLEPLKWLNAIVQDRHATICTIDPAPRWFNRDKNTTIVKQMVALALLDLNNIPSPAKSDTLENHPQTI